MNFWKVFLPHIALILSVIWCLIGFLRLLTAQPPIIAWAVYLLVLAGFSGTIIFLFSDLWLRAGPTSDWETKVAKASVGIILGYGYEEEDDNMQPGEANRFLLQWAIDNTQADLFLVQEGVWAAAGQVKASRPVTLQKIHRHDPLRYVNTFETAFCAFVKIQEINNHGLDQIVLVAHDLQLQRAYWDFTKVKNSCADWSKLEIIIPNIPDVPYVKHPAKAQQHTGSELCYKLIELFLARPRDYLAAVPQKLDIPMDPGSKVLSD